jgi:predicted membrane GTPase involved in stress response
VKPDAPCKIATTIDWSQYVGRIAIGRIAAGTLRGVARVTQGRSIQTSQIAS